LLSATSADHCASGSGSKITSSNRTIQSYTSGLQGHGNEGIVPVGIVLVRISMVSASEVKERDWSRVSARRRVASSVPACSQALAFDWRLHSACK
jgi:hypothetical protein